ncbi:hypothetical protein WG66_008165 [Moniliophthora roreri]|nr:hypothetical protein WG66_008165 [Moniliophthora roreri]
MSSQIPEELSDFFSVENEIVMPISTLSTGDYEASITYLVHDTEKTVTLFIAAMSSGASKSELPFPLLSSLLLRTPDVSGGFTGKLESGIIYPICMIAVLIVAYIPGNTTPFDPSPVAALAAGLAPTLILVRAKLGKTVESLQDKVSDMRFTSPGLRETTTTISQAQAHPIANLSLVPHDIERSGGSEEKSSTEKEAIDV